MNKFWLWMQNKCYSEDMGCPNIVNLDYGTKIDPTKQMLIGYMIEYIKENENKLSGYNRILFNECMCSDDIYRVLDKLIDTINK